MTKIYAVYTQYEPTYKYEAQLESIWSTRELAEKAQEKLKSEGSYDHVTLSEIFMDSESLYFDPNSPDEI